MKSIFYHLTFLFGMSSVFNVNASPRDSVDISYDSAMLVEILAAYEEAYRMDSLLAYQFGEVTLADGLATLTLDSTFKYLNPDESKKILEDAWGNPPQETLGMIFPDTINPYLYEGWGVVISYIEDGYIDDEDAKEIDYDDLLTTMQDEALEESDVRRERGYSGYEVVGWADQPYYDEDSKKIYWAKELKFDETEENTLNYDIRVLGRKGFLQLKAVAGISQISDVKLSMQDLLSLVEFNKGNTYFDFDPSVDEVAAYGVGALVAGKIAAKAGFLKVIGIFLAKSWKILLVGGGALVAFLRRFWTGKEQRDIG